MTAGYTLVKYAGIEIHHCLTRQFEETPVFDQSNTDLIYHRFHVSVIGYVHGHTDWNASVHTTGQGVNGPNQDAAAYHRSIRHRVIENRQPFEMRTGVTTPGTGTVLLKADPAPTGASPTNMNGFDLNNGPRCTRFAITQVVANEIFRVEADFEICKLECNDEGEAANNNTGVLSNRWSCVDDVDQNLYTTRTYQGRLRTFTNRINPNAFRSFVVPPLQPGLRRERMAFHVTEDGLTLEYTIIDREVAFSAPFPATNWNYRYTESTGEEMNSYGELQVMLEGDRNVNRKELFRIAAAMIETKLLMAVRLNNPNQNINNANIVEFLSFSEETGSSTTNRVYAVAKVKRTLEKWLVRLIVAGRLGTPVDAATFNNIVANYDANYSLGGRPGEAPFLEGPIQMAGAFAAYLQRPCSTNHAVNLTGFQPGVPSSGGPAPPSRGNSGGAVEVSARIVPSEDSLPADYLSDAHLQAIYTHWKMDSTYEINDGKVALPIARSVGSQSSSDQQDSVAIVSLFPSIARRTVRLSGERVGVIPELPEVPREYEDGDGVRATRMAVIVKPATSTRTPEGKEFFRVDAEYRFQLSRAPRSGELLAVGRNPWDRLGVQSMAILAGSSSGTPGEPPPGQA